MSEKVYTQDDVNKLISDAIREHKLQRDKQEREQQVVKTEGSQIEGIDYKAEADRIQDELTKMKLVNAGYTDKQVERYAKFVLNGVTTLDQLVADVPPVKTQPVTAGIDTGGKQGKYGTWNPFK